MPARFVQSAARIAMDEDGAMVNHSLLEWNSLATFKSRLKKSRSQCTVESQKSLTLFLQSNFHSKAKNPADDIGQLVTYYSCDMLQTTPPSQIYTIETILF